MSEFAIPGIPSTGAPAVAKRKYSRLAIALAVFGVLLLVVLGTLGSTLFGYRAFKSSGSSMEPAMLAGDHFYVDYGAYYETGPKRGDIIAFHPPSNKNILIVKRVVGLPGERVTFKQSAAIVMGKPTVLKKLGDAKAIGVDPASLNNPNLVFYSETYEDGTSFTVGFDLKRDAIDQSELVVPADQYYVAGDNRDYSNDSRFFGAIPRASIVGKVDVIWGNFNSGSFWLGYRPAR